MILTICRRRRLPLTVTPDFLFNARGRISLRRFSHGRVYCYRAKRVALPQAPCYGATAQFLPSAPRRAPLATSPYALATPYLIALFPTCFIIKDATGSLSGTKLPAARLFFVFTR